MNPPPPPPCARCSRCGKPLVEARLEGVCPACLWTDVFSEPAETGEADAPGAKPGAPIGLVPIPGHEVREEIARGGMGIVYRARQLEPPRTVALKMLLPHQSGSEQMRGRFRIEIQAIAGLEHPAILPVYQVGEQDGLPWFTMKLAGGGSLVSRRAAFAGHWRDVAGLVATVADAVQFAHERGVLHRDLKPGNILFDEAGRPYVSDFGLAKVIGTDSDLTRSMDFLGTPHYAAPEVAAGSARNATISSDIYSLGAILYELLAGRPPFEAEGVPALLRKIAEEEPGPFTIYDSRFTTGGRKERGLQPASTHESTSGLSPSAIEHSTVKRPEDRAPVPRDLSVICLKCLAKEPVRRYATARELADDLRRWLAGRPILARPATRLERVQSWARRNPVVATLAGTLVVVVVAGVLLQARAYQRVRHALEQSQESLHASLIAQARAQRMTGRLGQRFETIETIRRAAQIRRSPELRNELAAALARPDLSLERRWPVAFDHSGTTIGLAPDLGSYIEPGSNGVFRLRSALDQSVLRQFTNGHPSVVLNAAFSPDGRFIATGLEDGVLEVWPVDGARPLLKVPGTTRSRALAAFHPDGHSLALQVPGEGLFLHSLIDGRRRLVHSSTEPAIHLSFEPKGEGLAVVRANSLEAWSVLTNALVWSSPVSNAVPHAAWSPNRRWLIAASEWTQEMVVFESRNGQVFTRFPVRGFKPGLFEFSPGGQQFASESWDRSLRFWDVMSGQELLRADASVRALRFSPDGRRLAASPANSELGIFELAPSHVFREFRHASVNKLAPTAFARSRNGRFLLSTIGNRLTVWDAQAGEEVASALIRPGGNRPRVVLAFGPDDREIIYACSGVEAFRCPFVWHEGDGGGSAVVTLGSRETTELAGQDMLYGLSADSQSWLVRRDSGMMELWPDGHRARARVIAQIRYSMAIRLSPDGRWALTTDYPGTDLDIWDAQTGTKVKTFADHSIGDAWFSPDGRWVLASTPREYRWWETGTWQPGPVWPVDLGGVFAGKVAFAHGGSVVAVQDARGTFLLRTVPDGRELVRLEPQTFLGLFAMTMADDASRLWILGFGNRVFEWNLSALRGELAKLGLDWAEGR